MGWLLSYLNDDWDKYGVEISKFASNHAKQYGNVFNGILENFPDNGKFDVIVMNHLIEHLEDPVWALKN